ncbi:MAG: NAD-dependent epimerase/dehydratase [Myxococcales bacterium]|nr:NAD-dependent epimerase/dehydratase [Myxococcales bacterium]
MIVAKIATRSQNRRVPPWVIVGCGYVGSALAYRLEAAHHRVIATRRPTADGDPYRIPPASTAGGTAVVAVELGDPKTLTGVIPAGAIVVCCAPPGPDPQGETTALVDAARTARRLIYISSTGVYPPAGGDWVDETWPVHPATAAGRAREVAETVIATAPISNIVLRVAGIHGSGRGLVDRIRSGTYRIIGDGRSHVSRIHIDDLVEAIVRAGASSVTGAVNIADDDPEQIGVVADAIASKLGLPSPPRVSADSVDPEVAGMLTANRRIANRRMKQELGVVLRYPSWRTIYDALTPRAGA